MSPICTAIAASLSTLMLHPAPTSITASLQQAETERADLGSGLYMLTGNGGNILFSTGDDGTFVVDSQFANVAEQNLELIKEVSDGPIVFVLNTHFHGDHTGGNEAFYSEGATIIAHENVRSRLANTPEARAIDTDTFPVITFSENTTFYWNSDEFRVMHAADAHTDGDAFLYLPKSNVIHTGDLMFAGRYPYVDLGSGGSVGGAISALEAIHDLADKDTRIVPGHGPLSSRDDVAATITMLQVTRALVRAEMMKGLSRDDVIAADPLADYNETWSWRFINGDRMTGTQFDDLMATDAEAKAAVDAGPAKEAKAVPASATKVTASSDAMVNEDEDQAATTRLEAAQDETEQAVNKARSRAAEVIEDLTKIENDSEDADDPQQ
ncbi:MBL fold metallo-hydrolase [Parvularcula marina]|uniref:MBL fold metallo-hydrolase n=1 Tax=Parvularcula marina TaxID=2292771 RepID=UPI0035140599